MGICDWETRAYAQYTGPDSIQLYYDYYSQGHCPAWSYWGYSYATLNTCENFGWGQGLYHVLTQDPHANQKIPGLGIE